MTLEEKTELFKIYHSNIIDFNNLKSSDLFNIINLFKKFEKGYTEFKKDCPICGRNNIEFVRKGECVRFYCGCGCNYE